MTIFELMMTLSGLGIVTIFIVSLANAFYSKQKIKNVLETMFVGSNEYALKKKWTVYIYTFFWVVFTLGLLGGVYTT
jgi:hypothetical protein